MTKSISGNELLEYGSFQGNMFGTKIETIQKIHEQGKIALLDVEPQVSQLYHSRLLEPFWKYLKWWYWPKVRKIRLQGWMIVRAYWAGSLWRSKPTTPPVHTSLLGSADFTRLHWLIFSFPFLWTRPWKSCGPPTSPLSWCSSLPPTQLLRYPNTLSRMHSGTSKRLDLVSQSTAKPSPPPLCLSLPPRRKTCRWSRKSRTPSRPRTDTSSTWSWSTTTWTKAWKVWRRPWSAPPPPRSGCLYHGCTDGWSGPRCDTLFVEKQCNITPYTNPVSDVPGVCVGLLLVNCHWDFLHRFHP